MNIQTTIFDYFKEYDSFTMSQAYEIKKDVPKTSIRARIYEGLKKGKFLKVARGVFKTVVQNNETLLINGNGRDLGAIPDGSIDAIITDHPYDLDTNKGGNRNFANYNCFQYTLDDFKEKFRVMKDGAFLVEFLPEESGTNWEYLSQVKALAVKAGFEYYTKVPWKKGTKVNNTGRKASNCEDVLFFSKGKPRKLKFDTQRNIGLLKKNQISYKKGASSSELKTLLEQNNLEIKYMSATKEMLPTLFDYQPPNSKEKIHQSQKPVDLIKKIISLITEAGEWVLDQFGGSFVTSCAAIETGRNSIVYELDEEVFNKGLNHLNKMGYAQEILIS